MPELQTRHEQREETPCLASQPEWAPCERKHMTGGRGLAKVITAQKHRNSGAYIRTYTRKRCISQVMENVVHWMQLYYTHFESGHRNVYGRSVRALKPDEPVSRDKNP